MDVHRIFKRKGVKIENFPDRLNGPDIAKAVNIDPDRRPFAVIFFYLLDVF